MVDVQASNEKLRARASAAVAIATAAPDDEVAEAIAAADGDTKVAIVSLLADVDARDRAVAADRGARRCPRGGGRCRGLRRSCASSR